MSDRIGEAIIVSPNDNVFKTTHGSVVGLDRVNGSIPATRSTKEDRVIVISSHQGDFQTSRSHYLPSIPKSMSVACATQSDHGIYQSSSSINETKESLMDSIFR